MNGKSTTNDREDPVYADRIAIENPSHKHDESIKARSHQHAQSIHPIVPSLPAVHPYAGFALSAEENHGSDADRGIVAPSMPPLSYPHYAPMMYWSMTGPVIPYQLNPYGPPIAPISSGKIPVDKYAKEQQRRIKAAIVFQKYTRRYLVRKEFGDLKLNRIVRYRDPVKYWTEYISDELLRKDWIPDILVELSDECEYLSFSRGKNFRAHWLRYHLLEEAIQSMTRDCLRETIFELSDQHLRRVNQQEEPFPVRHFFWQVIDTEIEAVINELVVEMGNEAILETKANELFDMLLGDVISSELMLSEVLEEMTIEWVFDWFLEDECEYAIKSCSLEVCNELGRKIYTSKPKPPKSMVLNSLMGRILDEFMISALASNHPGTTEGMLNHLADQFFHQFVLDSLLPGVSGE